MSMYVCVPESMYVHHMDLHVCKCQKKVSFRHWPKPMCAFHVLWCSHSVLEECPPWGCLLTSTESHSFPLSFLLKILVKLSSSLKSTTKNCHAFIFYSPYYIYLIWYEHFHYWEILIHNSFLFLFIFLFYIPFSLFLFLIFNWVL